LVQTHFFCVLSRNAIQNKQHFSALPSHHRLSFVAPAYRVSTIGDPAFPVAA